MKTAGSNRKIIFRLYHRCLKRSQKKQGKNKKDCISTTLGLLGLGDKI